MKNLFDYATKELSQDAFLMWLFENHEDPVLGDIANSLLNLFCGFQNGEKVQSLETVPQWCKIDISVWMTTTRGRKLALFIEDKTFSSEHNQLSTYDNHIDGITDHEIYKIFYKTSVIPQEEITKIEEYNARNKYAWNIYDINAIARFFEKYQNSKNLIVAQYANYVMRLFAAEYNTKKPEHSKSVTDLLAWKSYFNKTVIPALKGNNISFVCSSWKANPYPYVVLFIKKLGFGNRNIPYLEIRSRDCCENNFTARILCYGVEDSDMEKYQPKLIENIKSIPDFECKRLVNSHNGKKIYPKQVGYSKKNEKAETDEQFIALVVKYIGLYFQAMKDWK